jgi:hypothetical protein
VIALADLLVQLLGDLVVLVFLAARPTRSLAAENLLLRRQLALYLERGTKPPRIDAATRITLAWLSRLCDWRSALVVARPQTVIRWHRAERRLLWRYKSRPGRPPIPHELRHLIRRMANENPLWGEERIANELLVKLGVRLSPRTVRKYMPKQPSGRPCGDQRRENQCCGQRSRKGPAGLETTSLAARNPLNIGAPKGMKLGTGARLFRSSKVRVRSLNGCRRPILLKNSKMRPLRFLAKLNRDRQFAA